MELSEEDQYAMEIIKNLDPETRDKFENGELSVDDLKGLGILKEGDSMDDYGEEGELEQDSEENSEENPEEANKKQKKDDEAEE